MFRGFLLIFGILQRFLCNLRNSDKIWLSFSEICSEYCQNLVFFFEKLRKICKLCNENLLKFSGWSGAKECKSCRAQKMLQNAPFLAIVAVDTDENEPSKVRQLDN